MILFEPLCIDSQGNVGDINNSCGREEYGMTVVWYDRRGQSLRVRSGGMDHGRPALATNLALQRLS